MPATAKQDIKRRTPRINLGAYGLGGNGQGNYQLLLFFRRRVQCSENGGQRTAFSRQRSADSVQRTACSGQRSADSVQRAADSGQRSADSVQQIA